MSEKAILAIDIQNDYFAGGALPLWGQEAAAQNAAKVIAEGRRQQVPIIFIQHLGSESSTFFRPGTEGVHIHESVKPLDSEKIFGKHYPNSFHHTDLRQYLQSLDIEDLVICGMMTHMCIDATTRAAKDFGFNCTVIGDACTTKDLVLNGETVPAESVHRSFLAGLSGYYATVISAAEYLK